MPNPSPIVTEPVTVFLTIITVLLITPLLSERAHLPGIIGLILGGLLVGPHGLDLLATGQTITLLSTVGLIYLMFSAGLEIDLVQFSRVRYKSLLFGLLTFGLPEVSGVALGRIFGFDWTASILMGSIYASHTLVAFPLLTRLGILRNEAVSVTVGATVFTDVLSLLVLAVIAGARTQGATAGAVVRLIVLMAGYAGLVLFGLPPLGKFFFRHFSGREVEFQFVLVALFVSAFLAQIIGMHAIVGAFLAGLAINSTLPPRSRVAGHVLFLGELFFIPIFLMYIGMLLDPASIVADSRTLLLGISLTVAVYVTKYLAAWGTARIFGYSSAERMTMWGLSQAQAAATLATILVAVNVGIFPQSVLNAAILMVLLTVITSPIVIQRFGEHVESEPVKNDPRPMFKNILVPVSNPDTQENLITLGGILAREGEGTLFPINVAHEQDGRVEEISEQRKLFEAKIFNDPLLKLQPLARIDNSVARGILRAAVENDASLILLGWRGETNFRQSIFGTVLDEVVWNANVPVLVSRLTKPINSIQRVILMMPHRSGNINTVPRTVEMVLAISRAINTPLLIMVAPEYTDAVKKTMARLDEGQNWSLELISDNLLSDVKKRVDRTHDLIAITTFGSSRRFRSSLGMVPERVARITDDSLLVIHYP